MKRFLTILFWMFAAAEAGAQKLSLQQCIDTALARNPDLRRSALDAEDAEVQWKMARAARLPGLSADLYHGISQGRGIDPTSNGYVNQNLHFANYQLQADVVLFQGGSLRNTQRQQASALEAASLETASVRDYLVVSVITAYLQVLVYEDVLETVRGQSELSRLQYERLRVLDAQGAVRPTDVSDLKGQWMNDQLALVGARQALEGARLALAQLLNRSYDSSLTPERLDTVTFGKPDPVLLADAWRDAAENFPGLRAAALRVQSARYAVRAAQGSRLPVVSLGAGMGTAYSSAAQNASGKTPYQEQVRNNLSRTVGIGLSLPLFTRFRSRQLLHLAQVEWKRSEVREEGAVLRLRQQVEGAWLALQQAGERFSVLREQVAAYASSFQGAEARYNAGVGSSLDYLTARERLDRARINLVVARYDLELRRRILDYFRGRP